MYNLTDEELEKRQLYYQGYQQCMVDLVNLAKEHQAIQGTKNIYINPDNLEKAAGALMYRIETTFDWGYMYYDEKQKQFAYVDEEFIKNGI